MDSYFKFKQKYFAYFLSPIIMLVVLIGIYFLKGIYPFGQKNIAYYDMAQLYVPIYYHTWDVLHGAQGIFWDWNANGGTSFVDTFFAYVVNPFNLIFLFTERENIINDLSWLLLLKVVFSAFSMSYYSEKKYNNVSMGWKVVFGVIYASSGYMIQYYTNMYFLDFVAIFPLIMFALDKIIEGKRNTLYILLIAIGMALNIQMMFMICVYIVLYTFITTIGYEARKRILSCVAVNTLWGILVAAVVWIPSVSTILFSSRVDNSFAVYREDILYMLFNVYNSQKLFMLYGLEIVFALFVYYVINRKGNISRIKKEFVLFCLMISPIFVECINIIWHIGGYACFPMRFAYISVFSGVSLAGKLVEDNIEEKNSKIGLNIVTLICGIACVLISFYCLWPLHDYASLMVNLYNRYWISLVVLICFFFVALFINADKRLIFVIIIFQCIIGWYILLAPQRGAELVESSNEYISICNDLSNRVAAVATDEDSRIARVRDNTVSLATNYAVVLNNSALSAWYNGCNGDLLKVMHNLGYSERYIRIMDAGATLFSDAFFHIRKIISFNTEMDKSDALDSSNEYDVGENSIYYPFGLLVDDLIDVEISKCKDAFDYQNELFIKISGEESVLFEKYDINKYLVESTQIEGEMYGFSYKIPVEGNRRLYFSSKNKEKTYYFFVNDVSINVPSIGELDNIKYPSYYNNGIIDLGDYTDEIVVLDILTNEFISEDDILVASMDIELLKQDTELQNNYKREITPLLSGLKYNVDNRSGYKYLILPIGYQKSFWCFINGDYAKCEPCIENALVQIPLKEGTNDIFLFYIPQGLFIGVIISLLSIAFFFKYSKLIINSKNMQSIVNIAFNLLFWGIIGAMYIIPLFTEIVFRYIWNPFGI